MMSLKDDILRRWAACQNEHERGEVLSEIEGARHEIRVEYLWAQPELRAAISSLEDRLTAIMRGQYRIAPVHPFEVQGEGGDHGGGREAPLVGIAGHIAMILAMRAGHQDRMHAELQGGGSHVCRVHDAMKVREHRARPVSGFTGYVHPVDPLTVPCPICEAAVGARCAMAPGR